MNGVLSKDLPFARAKLPCRTSTCYRNLFRAPIAAGKIEVQTPFSRSNSQSNVNRAGAGSPSRDGSDHREMTCTCAT
jgi:hypothetical protein